MLFVWRLETTITELDEDYPLADDEYQETTFETLELDTFSDVVLRNIWSSSAYSYKKDELAQLFSNSIPTEGNIKCKYCNNICYDLLHLTGTSNNTYCTFCGWGQRLFTYGRNKMSVGTIVEKETILREFDINSEELTYDEIGKFLSNNYSEISTLTPRRVELLIADIFKNQGYSVEVTQVSRDGGYDIILFNNGAKQIVVEVKRHKSKVGIDLIRSLRGVQLTEGFKQAILVSTSGFTRDATKEARKAVNYDFTMNLFGAEEILKALDIYKYNKSLVDKIKEIQR